MAPDPFASFSVRRAAPAAQDPNFIVHAEGKAGFAVREKRYRKPGPARCPSADTVLDGMKPDAQEGIVECDGTRRRTAVNGRKTGDADTEVAAVGTVADIQGTRGR